MSWILGFIGHAVPPSLRDRLEAIHPHPLHRIEQPSLYIMAGGIPETCFAGRSAEGTEQRAAGWIVVGCGIELRTPYCEVLSTEHWSRILSAPTPDLKHLDGHYIVVQWQHDRVTCHSDLFGLRALYFAKMEGGLAFSTRLDWLARLRGHAEINVEQFGAHWRTFNQLSYESLVKGIDRLPPNSVAVCSPESFSMNGSAWTPEHYTSPQPKNQQEISLLLGCFLHPRTKDHFRLSFGLSGGLDSRLLLALLLADDHQQFLLHLFGDSGEPDVQVAQRIAKDENIEQEFFQDPIPPPGESIRMLQEYIPQSSLVATASSMLRLRYYPQMYSQRKMLIDGGMGEIARRQFMNRLLIRGTRALHRRDTAAICKHISVHRASIFNPETDTAMRKGVESQVRSLWDTMPGLDALGEESFVDLLIVRYRFPNYGGMEQARMDGQILNYMPFAQPSFVRAAFAVPLQMKRKARMFRQLINAHRPALKRYPLVKGFTTYPYVLPSMPALGWTKIKSKIKRQFTDPTPVNFLTSISQFVLDTVHSSGVYSFPLYDRRAILTMVEKFYAGKKELAGEVDWWLAFEVWRQSLGAV